MGAQHQPHCWHLTSGTCDRQRAYSAPLFAQIRLPQYALRPRKHFEQGSTLSFDTSHPTRAFEARLADMSRFPPYDSARVDSKKIRVVHVAAGRWHDPIRCTLFRRGLDEASDKWPYKALSYVWGSSKVTETIDLEGNPFQITLNLSCALRHLRKVDQSIRLWVDALVSTPSGPDHTRNFVVHCQFFVLMLA